MKVPHYIEIKVRRWWFWPRVRLGFLFDMYSWFLSYEQHGITLSENGSQEEIMKSMLYNAAVSACRAKAKKEWFTADDVARFIDNARKSEADALIKKFIDSKTVLTDFAETAQVEKKK
ncbi:MAG: hypothetical protein ACQ9ET_00705 [Nitrosomonadaceae bacterium]